MIRSLLSVPTLTSRALKTSLRRFALPTSVLVSFVVACGDDDPTNFDPTVAPDGGSSGNGSPGGSSGNGSSGNGSSGSPTRDAAPDGNAPGVPDAGVDATPDASTAANVTLSAAGALGPHLVDAAGKSLYFFVNDTAGSNASVCVGGCLGLWPAFDAAAPVVGAGLVQTDFGRFDRGDGVFQTTWKGRPLYYFANDTDAAPTAGEGFNAGRWFVARAYDLFFAANNQVTPQGGAAANAPFLTDGAGRSLYVFQNDTRGVGASPPVSACIAQGCVGNWPAWQKPEALADLVVPSTILGTDLTSFEGQVTRQLAYKGWPLYYFTADDQPGEVAGHSVPNWRALSGSWDGAF